MANSTMDVATERVFKLTAADLPGGPLRLNRWTEILDPPMFLQLLQSRLCQRQANPATRDSTLETDLIELLAIVDHG